MAGRQRTHLKRGKGLGTTVPMASQVKITKHIQSLFSFYNTSSKLAGVREPCKWNRIFDIVESQNALQVPLKAHPKTTMRDGAKLSQLQIPISHKVHSLNDSIFDQ